MRGVGAFSSPMCVSPAIPSGRCSHSNPSNIFLGRRDSVSTPNQSRSPKKRHQSFSLSLGRAYTNFAAIAAAASSPSGSESNAEEPVTGVKFQTPLTLPGCLTSLSLVGTGYREKVFAIIGVKVYAAGLYVNPSISSKLNAWKGKSAADILEDRSLFNSILQAPLEKSLQIVLVRDVDGKTFWDALDDAISPRIKSLTPVDQSALSTFRNIFQGRSLKKGTFIFLTWLDSSKMLVSVSSDGLPSGADATIESENVTFALFDVFLGDASVSPSLKASVANGLAAILN
ncbi:fatty-acid-binding protein 3, chloroplastic isoform X2 [Syzygium oleosum]|uniref:fatty-acid-binding protein 3, chloroplastic isoform X2 n=1 Tax=Syzygium oleosum TaxID=219896 RepID=UPI0011D297CE|nr:fatty-acid-binding protein 3, chloroplastic isoform X2 [Syzygium oleosum]